MAFDTFSYTPQPLDCASDVQMLITISIVSFLGHPKSVACSKFCVYLDRIIFLNN